MGILKSAGDLVYTFRAVKLFLTDFKDTDAYKEGIIDDKGKRINKRDNLTSSQKSVYTPFHRLIFYIKRNLSSGLFTSYAAAMMLLKENYIGDERKLAKILEENFDVDTTQFLSEQSSWFLVEGNLLAKGRYRIRNDKFINTTIEELAKANDTVIVSENVGPVGSILGIDIYPAIHQKSQSPVYVAIGELYK